MFYVFFKFIFNRIKSFLRDVSSLEGTAFIYNKMYMGYMVSTLDSESCDRSSNLRRAFLFQFVLHLRFRSAHSSPLHCLWFPSVRTRLRTWDWCFKRKNTPPVTNIHKWRCKCLEQCSMCYKRMHITKHCEETDQNLH